MTDPYREDLAYIHDAGYGHLARNAAPVLLDHLRRSGVKRGLVVDLGCGSGILSELVAAAGHDVLGIDLSHEMIALAGRRVPTATFRVESIFSVALPPCVAVAAVGEIVNFRFDSRNTKQAVAKLFRRVYDALTPGGLFLFDSAGPGRVAGGSVKHHSEGDDWAVLATAEEDPRRRLLTRRITSFRRVGEHYRRDHETHQLRLYPPADLVKSLRRAGFRVRASHFHGEYPLPPGLIAFAARKPR